MVALLVFSPSSALAQDDNPFGAPEDAELAADIRQFVAGHWGRNTNP